MVKIVSFKIRFLGGVKEVGRVGIAVKTRKVQLLMDYGVMLSHEPGFPMHVPSNEVDGVILTHSHLDHSGAVPVFHIQNGKPVYGNTLTFELAQLLISDFIHLSGYYLPFEFIELQSMMRKCVHLNFRETTTVGDIRFQLLNAGHIPGSAQILVEADGKRVLYTGDFNTVNTRLLQRADTDYGELDAVIMESTYADEDHSDRSSLEKKFVEHVTEIVEGGGTVLVPSFAVGRSQEIACVLAAHNFKYSVTVDGMIREVSRIMMNHMDYLRDPKLFKDAMRLATFVKRRKDRKLATKKPGAIISTAGMLKGGPAVFYISKLGGKSRNGVFLVSYQIPGTPGRELLEKGVCVMDGRMRKIKAQVEHFDFSSHCGAGELQETVKNLEGNPTVYVVHGAEGNCKRFAKWIRRETGLKAVAPKAGAAYTI
ncbi:MAG: MBL fold metallo-hydrolase [Thermoproteota archaeon]|nr:MBL fold metallo-hydrolase [Thermoproteota archaeon]